MGGRYPHFASRDKLTKLQRDSVEQDVIDSYSPHFQLKIEDSSVFVGLQLFIYDAEIEHLDIPLPRGIHFCVTTRTDEEREQGAPKLPHSVSNQSEMSAKGYIKGMLMRALDQSSNELLFKFCLPAIFKEIIKCLEYHPKLFRHVLYDLSQWYAFFKNFLHFTKFLEIDAL